MFALKVALQSLRLQKKLGEQDVLLDPPGSLAYGGRVAKWEGHTPLQPISKSRLEGFGAQFHQTHSGEFLAVKTLLGEAIFTILL